MDFTKGDWPCMFLIATQLGFPGPLSLFLGERDKVKHGLCRCGLRSLGPLLRFMSTFVVSLKYTTSEPKSSSLWAPNPAMPCTLIPNLKPKEEASKPSFAAQVLRAHLRRGAAPDSRPLEELAFPGCASGKELNL